MTGNSKPEMLWYKERLVSEEAHKKNLDALGYEIVNSDSQLNREDRIVNRVPVYMNNLTELRALLPLLREEHPERVSHRIRMMAMPNREVILWQVEGSAQSYSVPKYKQCDWIVVVTPVCPDNFGHYYDRCELKSLATTTEQRRQIEFRDLYGSRIQLREEYYDGGVGLMLLLADEEPTILCRKSEEYGHPRLSGNGWQPYCGDPDSSYRNTAMRLDKADILAMTDLLNRYVEDEKMTLKDQAPQPRGFLSRSAEMVARSLANLRKRD